MRRRSNIRFAAAVMLAGFAIGGCGGGGGGNNDGDRASPSSGPAARRSTTPSVPTPEAEVEAAYLAYWEMVQRLAEAPNPDDPEIAQRATGAILGELTDNLTTLRAQGEFVVALERYEHEVLSVEVTGETARVADCSIDDAARLSRTTGETLDERVVTVEYVASLVIEDGGWRVSDITQASSREGVSTCTA